VTGETRGLILVAASALVLAVPLAGLAVGAAERAAAPSAGAPPWRAPADAIHRAELAGVPVGRHEYGIPGHPGKHIHAHLDVFLDGRHVRVPAAIGIDISVPGVNRGQSPDGTPSYGGIDLCARPCIAALHTHDDSGVLHIESQHPRDYTLGEVFTEWNVRLDSSCVGAYCRPAKRIRVFVDGRRYTGNPRRLTLTDLQEIAIVIGSPPKTIPATYF
jgi:hypothetical protein